MSAEKKFHEGVGGRKTSTARVRIYPGSEENYVVNEESVDDYFQTDKQRKQAKQPLEVTGEEIEVSVLVKGGGMNSQAEAVRHGLARALVEFNEDYRKRLKSEGYLTRDSRKKERKKPGKRGARRSPQWRKR